MELNSAEHWQHPADTQSLACMIIPGLRASKEDEALAVPRPLVVSAMAVKVPKHLTRRGQLKSAYDAARRVHLLGGGCQLAVWRDLQVLQLPQAPPSGACQGRTNVIMRQAMLMRPLKIWQWVCSVVQLCKAWCVCQG